jgi:hypothetical protein
MRWMPPPPRFQQAAVFFSKMCVANALIVVSFDLAGQSFHLGAFQAQILCDERFPSFY